jgi:murein DD-endopeptidase MepM/ murein hydrolase activator NlpD
MNSSSVFKILFLLLCLVSIKVSASDFSALHDYDSVLTWGAQVEDILKDVMERVTHSLKPVEGRISSGFGSRYHPVLGINRHHNGLDIACAVGSEVRVPFSGVVSYAGRRGGYGLLIALKHQGKISESRYAHLSKILVQPKAFVKQGDVIGLSGQTGLATGPHLHFELYREGKAIDPETLLLRSQSRQSVSLPLFEFP